MSTVVAHAVGIGRMGYELLLNVYRQFSLPVDDVWIADSVRFRIV